MNNCHISFHHSFSYVSGHLSNGFCYFTYCRLWNDRFVFYTVHFPANLEHIWIFKWYPFFLLQMSRFFIKYSVCIVTRFFLSVWVINRDMFSDATFVFFDYRLNGKQSAFFHVILTEWALLSLLYCRLLVNHFQRCSMTLFQLYPLTANKFLKEWWWLLPLFVGILRSELIPSTHALEEATSSYT